MRRLFAFTLLITVGCMPATMKGPGESGKQKAGGSMALTVRTLTGEERSRWDRVRGKMEGYLVVGYFHKNKEWKFSNWDGWTGNLPRRPDGTYAGNTLLPQTEENAKEKADSTAVDATVILDMASKADPVIVSWFYGDGKSVKKAATPPRPELSTSLNAFLRGVQAAGGE